MVSSPQRTGGKTRPKRALILLGALPMTPLAAQRGRAADRVALDEVRKPADVLRFMGLRRGDRVLDYFTGTGYYAEIMARAVGPQGVVVGWNGAGFMRNERVRTALQELRSRNPNFAFYGTPQTAIAFPSES